jgi:Pectate lyase superfamily protein
MADKTAPELTAILATDVGPNDLLTVHSLVSSSLRSLKASEAKVLLGHSNVIDIRFYGAVDGQDSTAAIQAAFNAAGSGKAVYVPTGTYLHGPLTSAASSGLTIYGDGVEASVLRFVPTADNQVGLTVDRAGTTPTFNCAIRDMTLTTNSTAYHSTGLRLVDMAEVSLTRLVIKGYYGTAKDAVGLETQGRESLWMSDVFIGANIPWYIARNPNTTAASQPGYLSADHYSVRSCQFVSISGTTSAKPHSCILVEPGAHCSSVTIRDTALVGGKFAVHWNQSVTPHAYSSNWLLDSVRTEQGQSIDSSSYSLYFNLDAFTLRQLTLINCELDANRNAVFTRNVWYQNWDAVMVMQGSSLKICDIDDGRSMSWRGVSTQTAGSAGTLVFGSKWNLVDSSPHYDNQPHPHTAEWHAGGIAATYPQRPMRRMSAHKWYWGGTLAAGATLQLPVSVDNDWEHARIEVTLTIGSTTLAYGTFIASKIAGSDNGIVKSSGTANAVPTNTDGNLCLYCTGATPMEAPIYVRNRFASEAYVSVEVVGKRSAED